MTRRNVAAGTLQVRQVRTRVFKSISMASPKLFAINATRLLSEEISARSPKWVRRSIFGDRLSRGFPVFLGGLGSIASMTKASKSAIFIGKSLTPARTPPDWITAIIVLERASLVD